MVSCGAKKGQALWRALGLNPTVRQHAVKMESTNERMNPRPGSRMAGALHVLNDRGAAAGGCAPPARSGVRTRARGASDLNEDAYSLEELQHTCAHCGRPFQTKRGLGQHIVKAHPLEANDAVNTERVKARWPAEEVRLMARVEAHAVLAGGVRFMNQHLHDRFPGRSLEAIKGRRRQEAYKEMVREYCQEGPPSTIMGGDDEGAGAGAAMIGATGGPSAIETTSGEQPSASAHRPVPRQQCVDESLRAAISDLLVQCGRIRRFEAESLCTIARDSLVSGVSVPAIERWLRTVFPTPATHPPRKLGNSRHSPSVIRENRKQRRVREYAIVQTLYRKNKKSCLAYILGDSKERVGPSAVDFCDYWRPLIEAPSVADGDMSDLRALFGECRQVAGASRSRTAGARGIHLEGLADGEAADESRRADKTLLWSPVTVAEVTRVSVRAGTAPGLDGVSPRVWNSVPAPLRALLFNLLLLAREVPSSISVTRTVFLPKSGMPERPTPADYRPLSIGSVVLRHLNKILAKRLSSLDIFDTRQRGFRPVDGVYENVTVLSAVLGEARRQLRSLHVACVDVSKAFDTVSHKAIARALEEVGLPLAFREYVERAYANARTVLQPSGVQEVSMTQLGRGVRQGDPLSPLLFNLVVDRALGVLSEDVGYRMGTRLINALGYADDIVLLSSTKIGLQENLNRLDAAFARNGLSINAKKTGVLSLVASGRDKKMKVDLTPHFTLGGVLIPQRSPVEVWSYLGALYKGAREDVTVPPIAHTIERITKAPLKPQQRLRLLRDYLLPRYNHRWLVGSVTSKTLRGVDVIVRAAVRRWLRLPHDVPVGYFHAPITTGGLGLPLLRTLIPILKHDRLQRLCKSSLPAACAAAETTFVARRLVWCENQMRVDGCRVSTSAELRQQCTAKLLQSCDGRGLREVGTSKLSSYWVSADADAIPGADYVHYHHIRANCIPSRARLSRGRAGHDVRCRAGCPESETPAHCVQRCFRTHGGRVLRHNDLCRQVGRFLQQKGWQVDAELAYSTTAGRRRPDLTIARGGEAVVVDAQVVSSETALDVAHERKVEKYRSNNDLVRRVAEHTGVPRDNVRFTALTISWRGVWCGKSEREMRSLGLTMGQLRTLTTRVLWGSWLNWKRFNQLNSRFNPLRHSAGSDRTHFDPGGA